MPQSYLAVECIESFHSPSTGCLKLSGVTIAEQSFDDVFVVTSKDEVRVTVDSLVSGEDTARLIVGLVKRWLAEPVQFNKNVQLILRISLGER